MSLTMSCPRCDTVIDAEDEDDLVAQVQRHVRQDHGLDHTLPASTSSRLPNGPEELPGAPVARTTRSRPMPSVSGTSAALRRALRNR